MKNKIFTLLLTVCLLLAPISLPSAALSSGISAKSAVLIEADTESVLYQKNAFARLPMASTTKIMTALVAIEHGELDKKIKVDDRAVGTEGSSIYLQKGEVMTLRHLLYALMLASANDAASAIAYEIGGSIEGFAMLMNSKARELGLLSTHFTNPHGLHDAEHYTTAYELALIAAAALKNPVFKEMCSTKTKAIPMKDGNGTRYLSNHNKLLKTYDGAIGVKTGFTKNSGRCLVSAAERDGLTLIAVTLSAPDDWRDHKQMLDYGFENYCRINLKARGEFTMLVPVSGGALPEVIAANTCDLSVFSKKPCGKITFKTEINRPVYAPVRIGDSLGRVAYYEDGNEIASSPLVAINEVNIQPKKSIWARILEFFFPDK